MCNRVTRYAAEQPDCQITRTYRRTDAQLAAKQATRLPDALPDTLPDERADKLNSKQADLQNRWISRQIDAQPDMQIGHAKQMYEQQTKLNPIREVTSPASNILNAVSVENLWHRWTSIGNIDGYQGDTPAKRLQNAYRMPKKCWKRSSVLFCLFLVCSGGEHTLERGGM